MQYTALVKVKGFETPQVLKFDAQKPDHESLTKALYYKFPKLYKKIEILNFQKLAA